MIKSAMNSFLLFAPAASKPLGERIAARLGRSLAASEEREFGGGEHKIRPLVPVRGRNVYVIHSLDGGALASANDKLCRLLFFMGALRDAGAAHVTACLPYMAFARKDRRTKTNDPVNTRYVAQLLEAAGADRVLALDVHNVAAFENSLRCESISLTALGTFANHFANTAESRDDVVVSPDVGGIKRALFFQEHLEKAARRSAGSAFMEKKRSAGIVSGDTLVGDVAGRRVIIVDDLISSGGTLLRTTEACRLRGASSVHAAATHAVFSSDAQRLFSSEGPDSILVTDSATLDKTFHVHLHGKLRVFEAAPTIADAIEALENGEPLPHLTAF